MDTLASTGSAPPSGTAATLSKRVAALVGVLSVAAALGAGHLVAGFLDPSASPFLAVGNSAIDLTPTWLKNFAVENFGSNDKLVLLLGMAVVVLLFAVTAGLASRRRATPGVVFACALGGLGILAVLTRPDLGQVAVLAPLASLVAAVVVFRGLHRQAMARLSTSESEDPGGADDSRRAFLRTSTGVAVGAGVLGGLGQVLADRVDVEGSRAAIGPLKAAVPAPEIPPGADFSAVGTPKFITSNAEFYRVDTALSVPRLRAEEWKLKVHGMVAREVEFSYADIRSRPLVAKTVTLTCVSNEVGGPYISTADFLGVPLRDLLLEAGVSPLADEVFSTSSDGWTAGTPLDTLMDPKRGALLAIGMNGEPLPVEHGFPARMVVPGLYGYVSATKWLVDLEVTTFGTKTFYWEDRGWARKAPIKTQSRIDVPRGFAKVPAGRVAVAGIAWAQNTGIEKVEVRVDGGPWQSAELSVEVNNQTWRQWRTFFQLDKGSHRAEVRATDRAGYTQVEQRVDPIPDGATGWHASLFTVD